MFWDFFLFLAGVGLVPVLAENEVGFYVTLSPETLQNNFPYQVTLGPMPRYLLNNYPRFKAPLCYALETREHHEIAQIFQNMTKLSNETIYPKLTSKFDIMAIMALKRMRAIGRTLVTCRKNTWEWIKKRSPKKAALTLLKCREDINYYYRYYKSDMHILQTLDVKEHRWVEVIVRETFEEALKHSKNITDRLVSCIKGKVPIKLPIKNKTEKP